MKKWFGIILLLAVGLTLFSQEKKEVSKPMAAGLGLEWNMDARFNFAGGTSLSFDYKLPCFFAIGVIATGSTNFNGFNVIEGVVFLRNYVQRNEHSGFFLQIDVGSFIIFEDDDVIPMVEIGARAGFRIPLGSFFYIEPYGRLGVPFAFGLGVMAGINF